MFEISLKDGIVSTVSSWQNKSSQIQVHIQLNDIFICDMS